MVERKVFYGRLRRPQIREAARADEVITIPLAAIRQHRPRSPADGDAQLARGKLRARAIIAPPGHYAAGVDASQRQAVAASAR